jgi:hypothetical protein
MRFGILSLLKQPENATRELLAQLAALPGLRSEIENRRPGVELSDGGTPPELVIREESII